MSHTGDTHGLQDADAAERALSSFSNIYWIAGGKPKAGGIESLVSYLPRIRKAYLIGEAAEAFSKADPYAQNNLFERVVIKRTRQVYPQK